MTTPLFAGRRPAATSSVPGPEEAGDRLRVLHVISQLGMGGQERQLFLGAGATRGEIEHAVVSLSRGGVYAGRLRELGIRVLELERRGRGDPHRLMRLVVECRRFRPQVLHGHLMSGNLYALLARHLAYPVGMRPVLVTTRVTTRPRRSGLANRLEAMAFRASRIVWVNASPLREEICSTYGIPPHRVRVVPNMLEPEAFSVEVDRRRVREELGLEDSDIVVVHVASFSPEKRHDVALEGFAFASRDVPRLRLLLVGDGPERGFARKLAGALGIEERVRWLGWRDDVIRILKVSDIAINTSDREGSPNAVLEALGVGLPVVATRVGGTPELLGRGRGGVLVDPDDSRALGRALVELARAPERRRALGRAGKESVWKRHHPERVVPLVVSLYREAVAGVATPGAVA
jgi:glycosyltransferase involved in cell wall biosynthesis